MRKRFVAFWDGRRPSMTYGIHHHRGHRGSQGSVRASQFFVLCGLHITCSSRFGEVGGRNPALRSSSIAKENVSAMYSDYRIGTRMASAYAPNCNPGKHAGT